MTTRVLAALAATAILLGGCNETITRTTTAGKPVLAYAMAMYTDGSCWSWEPPEVSVATPPANGRVAHALVKAPLQMPGSKCDGQVVDARVSLYKPNPGFRGQDRLTLLYDGIRNDGGGRFVTSKDVVIDVK
ncbi:hypothetical protein [Bosea sp. (in: a-proteobacteria)]|jgi:hypothetical protein|uniref:hypothetical protein n=1 Tax=Bosea sp. (in: a-proteobacteria) TaxID=1871050 RepID=UPI001ACBE916|nr:hypothetical protein [Bosea sp. (in: a-proteobacteria)]MBN9440201.1 hypothetical protein [Bosea sp. (in: a-proteobacteria)]